ncbi:MAG: hypothetical protein LBH34_02140, partial [Prevotellaceae bacterium]|nr:hypothetical protein [Prevotellaceae bacterium]
MSSCSTTKHIPQGQYLLNKEDLKVEGKGVKKKDLEALVRQHPNKKIFAFRFYLWLYNLSSVTKDRKIDQFFQNLGEAPAIYDSIQSVVSLRRIEQYASFRGYYNAKAEVDVKYRKKKADVEYRVTLSEPYVIRNISYSIPDTTIDTSFITDTQKRLIHEGNVFDGQVLEAETNRINQEMRNRGYYQFHKGYLSYQADTMVGDKQVDIRLIMQKEQVSGFDEPQNHRRYYVKSLGVNADYDLSAALNNSRYAITGWDTVNVYNVQMYYKKKPGLKPDIAAINNTIKIGHLYSEQDVSRTYSNFSNLRLF